LYTGSPLLSVLFVLLAALISASVLARLRQPNLIGYLLAGMLIGPHGLKLVPYENVELLAEIGIGLVMFTIGVELSIAQLLRVKNVAVLGGSLILLITISLCRLVAPLFHWSAPESVIWGIVTGLSSTIVVLKILAERGEVGSPQGNVCTGILLYQDVVSIPILVLLPLLATGSSQPAERLQQLLLVLARLAAFLSAIYFLGRFLVPRLLRFVAHIHNKELFSLSVLCITLGIAAITAGAGLSLALGAFLAGLIVSESDFGNQAASEVLPLKDSFSAIFFVSVGMLLDGGYLLEKWPVFTLGLALIMAIKFLVVLWICFLFRYPNKISTFVALALCQISEFGFLILLAARKQQLISDGSHQRLLGTSILSIILTPYLLKAYPRIKKAFAFMNRSGWIAREVKDFQPLIPDHDGPASGEEFVILCGYGPTGTLVAKRLREIGMPVVVVDLNYRMVQSLKAQKMHAIYGDSSSSIVLEAAGLAKARLLLVTIPDPQAMRALVKKVKRERPDLPIILRVRYQSDRDSLLALGADSVVWEEEEAGEEVARRALDSLNVNPAEPN
jgi:monovalent cation:H+ antiporter-2, CPA2 family